MAPAEPTRTPRTPTRVLSPFELRAACRRGEWNRTTAGQAPGFVQANLVVLLAADAVEFREFCVLNPAPCPLVEVTRPGVVAPDCAPNADLRSDLPAYRVWKAGRLVEEPGDVLRDWRDDFVSFLIGCSFTFETALQRAGLQVRHIDEGRNVPMFRTNRPCRPAGRFRAELVVSMRLYRPEEIERVVAVTTALPGSHGGPVHVGDPTALGIRDLTRPDFGEAVSILPGELPVFWACGVTPQVALRAAAPESAITHSPGCMFVTDLRDGCEGITVERPDAGAVRCG